ncbi:Clp protease N-terminal domain-containing protein [Bailinhaonella thermotolerans]|uniref:ATP-dependent Clp protease ATP-binding subunit n=1 Tax=Bailinhaonella thermotolerans TaxID=1070861 RepID=A0A3A4ATV7_9ACTN|nr:Clp protease N-terminal domain-containing protein [Bailinhaonella thermotolerans]RJL32049.1 ATP-dependent Clp protease ATP-binding subunit [Bailinhaonella thermotolerans]
MPKINVYLPDELAEAVKDAGVPVSAICQRALEQAVRRITAIRETALGEVRPDVLAERFPATTARLQQVLRLAIDRAEAADAPNVTSGDLLAGMIDEGRNLALHVLHAMEIDPARVRQELDRRTDAAEDGGAEDGLRFSLPAAGALELTVTEATALGHNYVGCEHLLLGLVTEPDGVAGRVLRELGAEPRLTRRAVTAALAGYVHLRAQTAAQPSGAAPDPMKALGDAVREHLRPLTERLDRMEAHVATLERRIGPSGE